MGSSCSRDAPGAVIDTDPAVRPMQFTRSTEASIGANSNGRQSSVDTLGAAEGGSNLRLLSRLRRTNPSGPNRQQEREIREIEQLQFELAAMEALFQSMLGQAFREMANGGAGLEGPGGGGPPPASNQAVRRLPLVRVSAEDLVEEANRECIICYVENHINDRVVRLPCGHLFHRDCITQWLVKRCTCPVCRYELPTDDPHYERGRVERMGMRRPRMRRHELERMPSRELRELAFTRLNLSNHFDILTNKADLIDRIVRSGKVDIIAGPDPVEYKMSDLKSMSVSSLRHKMTDAGVIFDPVDVLEKDDMVQLFVGSGRVAILPEDVEQSDHGKSPRAACGAANDGCRTGESNQKQCTYLRSPFGSEKSGKTLLSPARKHMDETCAKSDFESEKLVTRLGLSPAIGGTFAENEVVSIDSKNGGKVSTVSDDNDAFEKDGATTSALDTEE